MISQQECEDIISRLYSLTGTPVKQEVKDRAVVLIKEFAEKQCILLQLTDRNLEVLGLIGQGFTKSEIGEQLYLSPRTIEFHIARLKRVFNCKNVAHLVKKATDYKII